MKISALVFDTFREIYSKKIIFAIIGIEVLTLLILGLRLFSDDMQIEFREAALAGGQTVEPEARPMRDKRFESDSLLLDSLGAGQTTDSLDSMATGPATSSKTFGMHDAPANTTMPIDGNLLLVDKVKGAMGIFGATIAGACLFLGILATAGIVPSMMEKGTIDLLLSKPLPRWALLFGRALGGMVAVAINLTLFALISWILFGMASGVWPVPFLTLTIGLGLFGFVVVYSGVILLNVLTESWVLPMILAWLHIGPIAVLLANREATLFTFIDSPIIRTIIDGVYYVLPQEQDLVQSLPGALYSAAEIPTAALIQCLVFTMVALGLAAWRFEKKDF